MVTYVNERGGWRVCGWHRQGVRNQNQAGDVVLSFETKGHITLLQPTDPELVETEEFKNLRIETPTDDRVPENLNAAGPARPAPQARRNNPPAQQRRPPQQQQPRQNQRQQNPAARVQQRQNNAGW